MNKFLIGCAGVLLVAAILIGVLILETPRFLEAGKSVLSGLLAEEARITSMEQAWQPPTSAPDAAWFPEKVGEWTLDKTDAVQSIPALALTRPGQTGAYHSNRGWIEVSIVPVAEGERAAVLLAAQDALKSRADVMRLGNTPGVQVSVSHEMSRVTSTRGNRTYVRIGAADHTRLWWVKEFLFVFRANGSADSETFPEEFLHGEDGQPRPPADGK